MLQTSADFAQRGQFLPLSEPRFSIFLLLLQRFPSRGSSQRRGKEETNVVNIYSTNHVGEPENREPSLLLLPPLIY